MKSFILLLPVLFLLCFLSTTQSKGEMIPPAVDKPTYQLNGQGIREKWFFDLYIGKLYLVEKSTNAPAIIKANQPMVIELDILSNKITAEKMKTAISEGFNQSRQPKPREISQQIHAFTTSFNEKISKGDHFRFDYSPSKGTRVYKNDKLLITIAGLPFKQALFNIWLGDKPADKTLKKGMLGL